jgi:heme-degrading monooxygenase HmoA
MYAVIFEVQINTENKQEYLDIAAELKKELSSFEGFISVERFQSLVTENKLLSLSFWESEQAILNWKNSVLHKEAQAKGRKNIFADYQISIAKIERSYTLATSSFSI